jgi:hypothetical protein
VKRSGFDAHLVLCECGARLVVADQAERGWGTATGSNIGLACHACADRHEERSRQVDHPIPGSMRGMMSGRSAVAARCSRLCPGRLRGGQVAVVLSLGFGREASAQPVHQPGGVVPMRPGGGDRLQVGQGGDRPAPDTAKPSRTHSVLYSSIVVSAKALSSASPTVPMEGDCQLAELGPAKPWASPRIVETSP